MESNLIKVTKQIRGNYEEKGQSKNKHMGNV